MTYELQLRDYSEGYRFRIKCGTCNHGWNEEPHMLLHRADMHTQMYLHEVAAALVCASCRTRSAQITPIILSLSRK